MRSSLIVLVGFVFWGLCLVVAKWLDTAPAPTMTRATALFVLIWFLAAAVNLWVGVTRAGYTVREELPIFRLIFGLPAVVAVFVNWKFL